MKTKFMIVAAALCLLWPMVSAHAGNQSQPSSIVTQIGIACSNAPAVLNDILKMVPQNDTILNIRFSDPSKVEVQVCGGDPSQGCTRHYEKRDGKWKLGIIAHWHSEPGH